MRRVSIAIELIDDPALLLLDEPTSGLDSNLAYDLVNTLWDISRTGRTVVVSVHQPRSQLFSLFDSVVVLSGGKLVFQGPSERVKPYFSSIGYDCPADYNPADFIIEHLEAAVNFVAPPREEGGSDASLEKTMEDFGTTLACMFNIAGALFFVTGTLKFASYNSLMAFSQERALINRETAN
eukprot:Polyplicarium_translucidae@DN3106_c0_g1_i6.p1